MCAPVEKCSSLSISAYIDLQPFLKTPRGAVGETSHQYAGATPHRGTPITRNHANCVPKPITLLFQLILAIGIISLDHVYLLGPPLHFFLRDLHGCPVYNLAISQFQPNWPSNSLFSRSWQA